MFQKLVEYFTDHWQWYVVNGLLLGTFYGGYVLEIEGFRNVNYFALWAIGVIGILAFIMFFVDEVADDLVHDKAKQNSPFATPYFVDVAVDIFFIFTMVFLGHWVLGIFLVIAFVANGLFRQRVINHTFEVLKGNIKINRGLAEEDG